MNAEAVQLDPTGHLLHQATLSSPTDIAALSNTQNKYRDAAKMRSQRNISQMKQQNKIPEKKLQKMETSNLPDAELKILAIKMLNKLRGRVEELRTSNSIKKNMDL